jgi:hypothetical protein
MNDPTICKSKPPGSDDALDVLGSDRAGEVHVLEHLVAHVPVGVEVSGALGQHASGPSVFFDVSQLNMSFCTIWMRSYSLTSITRVGRKSDLDTYPGTNWLILDCC